MTRRPGFTVLEAAIGLLIIGLSGMGVLAAFSAHAGATLHAQRRIEATEVAETVLMRLRLHEIIVGGPLPDSLRTGAIDLDGTRYTWRASREPLERLTGLAELTVDVDGPSPASLATYQAFRPLRSQ